MNRIAKSSIVLGAVSLIFTVGCSSKNYVRSQTAPLVQKTNELDDATAANNRAIRRVVKAAGRGRDQALRTAHVGDQVVGGKNGGQLLHEVER